jgi:hypothetical protein
MDGSGIGAGLGALGFWGFLTACVWLAVWNRIRRREAQHETLRRLLESGQPVDKALLTRLVGGDGHVDRDLRIYGIVALAGAPGIALLGWAVSQLAAWALLPLLGAAALVACVGAGLLIASKAVKNP